MTLRATRGWPWLLRRRKVAEKRDTAASWPLEDRCEDSWDP